jgi:uncharacterized protein (DUF952 family)
VAIRSFSGLSRKDPTVTVTFHLTPRERWDAQRANTAYTPEPFESEGFIHCTDGEANVVAVGNRYYTGDPRGMVCLVIDCELVNQEIRYEDPERIYPHIFGPLNTNAVVDVRSVRREADGSFTGIGESVSE